MNWHVGEPRDYCGFVGHQSRVLLSLSLTFEIRFKSKPRTCARVESFFRLQIRKLGIPTTRPEAFQLIDKISCSTSFVRAVVLAATILLLAEDRWDN